MKNRSRVALSAALPGVALWTLFVIGMFVAASPSWLPAAWFLPFSVVGCLVAREDRQPVISNRLLRCVTAFAVLVTGGLASCESARTHGPFHLERALDRLLRPLGDYSGMASFMSDDTRAWEVSAVFGIALGGFFLSSSSSRMLAASLAGMSMLCITWRWAPWLTTRLPLACAVCVGSCVGLMWLLRDPVSRLSQWVTEGIETPGEDGS